MRKSSERWQVEAYVNGVMIEDWGAMELMQCVPCARELKREFPEAIVAIVPARY